MAKYVECLWTEGSILWWRGMIFVTVGTHTAGFNRLVEAADVYAATTTETVIVQKGSSSYIPKFAEYFDFASSDKIHELSEGARVIITHAGAGSVLTSLSSNASVVVVPRQRRYHEHVDDHQFELAEAIHNEGKGYMIVHIENLGGLLAELPESRSYQKQTEVPLLAYLKERISTLAQSL